MPLPYKIAMDLVADHVYMVTQADVSQCGQLFPRPDTANRIVRIA